MKDSAKERTWILPVLLVSILLFVLGYIGIHYLNRDYNYSRSMFSDITGFMFSVLIFFSVIGAVRLVLQVKTTLKMESLVLMNVMTAIVFWMAMIAELYFFNISLLGQTKIQLGGLFIQKKWLFDAVVIVLFPLLVLLVRKSLEQNDSYTNRISAGAVLYSFTLMEFLFFKEMGNVWIFVMAILNTVTVVTFVLSTSAASESRVKARRYIAAGYIMLWLLFLLMRADIGNGITGYMYDGNWRGRVESIGLLLKNASAFGTSGFLSESGQVFYELIYDDFNLLHSLLYYTGWVPTLIYLGMMTLFMWTMYLLLGRKNDHNRLFYPLYQAAYVNLLIRFVCGILYSFGILPIPVMLPFSGNVGFFMDGISLVLLIFSGCENGVLNGAAGTVIKDFLNENLWEEVWKDEDWDEDWFEDTYDSELNFKYKREDFEKAREDFLQAEEITDEEYYEILKKWNVDLYL